MSRRSIHSILIKINGVREIISNDLTDFKNMRKTVNENQRSKLETKIGQSEFMIKELNTIELNVRESL